MNKKGGSVLASRTGRYLVFIILFSLSVGFSLKFIERGEFTEVDFLEVEKSVIANRVISCISGDSFGEIDENKFNEAEIRRCFDDNKFNLHLVLDTGRSGLTPPSVSLGDALEGEFTGRLVLVNGEKARLGVRYKNAA
tara:strand:- start:589 stop:1002 length:414 start_codon:yes stop_codon:yes gene_type:complete